MSEPTQFRHYLISKTREGGPLELMRTEKEVVCLAYDTRLRRLVDLHALIDQVKDKSVFQQRTKILHATQHPGLAWFLEAGEDEGAWYYVTAHADGEKLDDYLDRFEQIPANIAAGIATSVIDSFLALESHPRLLPAPRLEYFTVEAGATESRTLLTHFQMREEPALSVGKPPSAGQVTKRVRALLGMVAQKSGQRWRAMEANVSSSSLRDQLELVLASPTSHLFQSLKDSLPWFMDAAAGAESFEELPETYRPRTFLAAHLDGAAVVHRSFQDQFIPNSSHKENTQGYEFPGRSDLGDDRLTLHLLPSRPICGEEPRQEVRRALLRHTTAEHPHLLRVIAFEDAVSSALFLEEFPAGQSLPAWKAAREDVAPKDAVSILDGVTQALREAELLGMKPFGLDPEDVYVSRPSERKPWRVQWRSHPSVKRLIRRPVADSVEYPALDFTWLACWIFDYQPDSRDTPPNKEIRDYLGLVWQHALQGEPLSPQDITCELQRLTEEEPTGEEKFAPPPLEEPEPLHQTERPLSRFAPPPAMATNVIYAAPPIQEEEEDPVAFAALTRPAYAQQAEASAIPEQESHGLAEVLFASTKSAKKKAREIPEDEPEESIGWMNAVSAEEAEMEAPSPYREYAPRGIPFLFKFLLVTALAALTATFLRNARHGAPAVAPATPAHLPPPPAAAAVADPNVRGILNSGPEGMPLPPPAAPAALSTSDLPAPGVDAADEPTASLPAPSVTPPVPPKLAPSPEIPATLPAFVPNVPVTDPNVPPLDEPVPRAIPIEEVAIPPAPHVTPPTSIDLPPAPRAIPVPD